MYLTLFKFSLVIIVHFKHKILTGFSKLFLVLKTALYIRWGETDLTYLFPFAFARSFHQYWKLLFKPFNRIKQTEDLSNTFGKSLRT